MAKQIKNSSAKQNKVADFYDQLIRKANVDGTTGRQIVAFRRGAGKTGSKTLYNMAGFKCVPAHDLGPSDLITGTDRECKQFQHLDLCVAKLDRDQAERLIAAPADAGLRGLYPETLKYASPAGPT